MASVEKLIDRSMQTGFMTEADHDHIMDLIHQDGRIDASEQTQISRLFDAIKRGVIRIVDEVPNTLSKNQTPWSNDKRPLAQQEYSIEIKTQKQSIENNNLQYDDKEKHQEQKFLAKNLNPKTEELTELKASHGNPETSFSKIAKGPRQFGETFSLRTERLLDVTLNGNIWIKTGSMVGYYGIIKFTREGIFEHGLDKVIKRKVTGEGTMLTKAIGQGNLLLADQGKKISLYEIGGRSLVVNGANILAFQESVKWDVTVLKQLAAIWSGGFFNVRLFGQGLVAITSHYDPIVLRVTPAEPLMTDMAATVAWSGDLVPEIKTDISSSTIIGRASGETIQMKFNGDGFVIIQPYEELPQK